MTRYWSIDFADTDGERAREIVENTRRDGLASDGIPADPEVFYTTHLDRESVETLSGGLDLLLAGSHGSADPRADPGLRLVQDLRDDLRAWLDDPGGPEVIA
ncbi:hypothetical protein I6A62_39815 [Frankia sp. AgW1.1]|nr:hypothetical protein [Frankia sp. AgW1.1]MBL7625294.1 hypothetical protein [Frankia sp. AgB1.8]